MSRTLRATGLSRFIDETSLAKSLGLAEVAQVTIRLVRDEIDPRFCAGYAYLDFSSHEDAMNVISAHHGQRLAGITDRIQLTLLDTNGARRFDEFQVYVGQLSDDVSDQAFYEYFHERSEEVSNAVIARDYRNQSRGFGFVRLETDEAAYKLVSVMNSAFSMRLSPLGSKPFIVREAYRRSRAEIERGVDHIENTTIFVGNLNLLLTEEVLKEYFVKFGHVSSCRIVPNRGFGFLTFSDHVAAYAALSEMQNSEIMHQRIYCSWGRNNVSTIPESSTTFPKIDQDDYYAAMYPEPPAKVPKSLHQPVDRSALLEQALRNLEPQTVVDDVDERNRRFINHIMLKFIQQL